MVKMSAVRVWLAVCLTMLTAGCSAPAETPGAAALKPLDPKAFQAVVDAAATELGVPGAVVLLRTPQGNFTAVTGTTELGTQTPPTADTHFRIASNTKTMTAAVIVLLAQDGKLKLSDPVSKYVPDVPNGDNITIAELLKMRSGLYNYTDDPELAATIDADPAKVWTPQEVLAIAFRHPPQFAPDAAYEYSNTNYALLGLVAEKVDGSPLAQQLQDRLFGPLGLKQTSLPAADDTRSPRPTRTATCTAAASTPSPTTRIPPRCRPRHRAGTLQPIDYTNQNPSYATAAGGVISTADDLATWIKALVVGQGVRRRLPAQWRRSLQAEDPDKPDGQKYGYGISHQRFGTERAMYLPRRRAARLQLVHGLRPGKRCDARHLDQSDPLARRQDHGATPCCPQFSTRSTRGLSLR